MQCFNRAWPFVCELCLPLWPVVITPLLAAVVLVLCLRLRGCNGKVKKGGHAAQQLPGSLGFPLIGETLEFALLNRCPIGTPPPFLSKRLKRYGPVFKTHLMGRPTVVSMDPELNKFLLLNEEKLVQVFYPHVFKKIAGPMLDLHGAPHRRLRDIIASFLTPAAIQARYVNHLQDHALLILRSWANRPTLDAQAEARKFIFNFITVVAMSLDATDPITVELMGEFHILMTGYASIPIMLPGTTYYRVMKAQKRIISMLRKVVRLRKENMHDSIVDVLDRILKDTDQSGQHYTEQGAVDVLFHFIYGGFETTSVLLTNVIKFLSENPSHLQELRAEHAHIHLGKRENEKLTWDDYKQMTFTDKVIYEALRLASVAHFLTRESLVDVHFKGITIPQGWMILINFSMVHLDSKFYSNPLDFDPGRWKGTLNDVATYTPFGAGLRSCVGTHMAKFEISMFLHYFVILYKWNRIIKEGELDEVSGLTLPAMSKGLQIQVEPLQ